MCYEEQISKKLNGLIVECYPDIGSVASVKSIALGLDNENFLMETQKGKFVLRCYRYSSEYKVNRELEFVSFLNSNGFPTPKPIKSVNGNSYLLSPSGKPISLFPYIEGKHIEIIEDSHLRRIGQLMAKLHNTCMANDYLIGVEKDYIYLLRDKVDKLSYLKLKDLGEFQSQANQNLDRLGLILNQNKSKLPFGPIHYDFNETNLLFDSDDEICAVLDFDECHDSVFIMDIAASFHYLALSDDFQLYGHKCKLILNGYEEVRKLSTEEMYIMPHCFNIFNLVSAIGFIDRYGSEISDIMECHSFQIYMKTYKTIHKIIESITMRETKG